MRENRLIFPLIADNAALGTSLSFPPVLLPRSVKTNNNLPVTAQVKVKTQNG